MQKNFIRDMWKFPKFAVDILKPYWLVIYVAHYPSVLNSKLYYLFARWSVSCDVGNTLFFQNFTVMVSKIYFRNTPQLFIVLWSDHRNRYLYRQMHFSDISQTFQRNFFSNFFEYENTEDEIQKGLNDLIFTLKNNSNVKKDGNSFYFNKKDLNPGISVICGVLPIHCVIIKKR